MNCKKQKTEEINLKLAKNFLNMIILLAFMMDCVLKTTVYVFNKEESVKNFVVVLNHARLEQVVVHAFSAQILARVLWKENVTLIYVVVLVTEILELLN